MNWCELIYFSRHKYNVYSWFFPTKNNFDFVLNHIVSTRERIYMFCTFVDIWICGSAYKQTQSKTSTLRDSMISQHIVKINKLTNDVGDKQEDIVCLK